MSLFKTRQWWSTTCGNGDEEFDQGCICVANIDNAPDKLDKIITGSFSGVLRVFSPHGTASQDNDQSTSHGQDVQRSEINVPPPSRTDSLLLEAQLPAPILQVTAGQFVSTSRKLYLAILYSRKLSVYGITAVEGNEVVVDVGAHYQLGLMYEHVLQRSAARLVVGPFGGVEGRDFACVLSLDGTLSFFEQESFAFARFLPGAVLPGPIVYVPHPADTFATTTSAFMLEVYRYQVLAVASSDANKIDGQNIKTGKKLAIDWFYNLGESALDMSVVTPKQSHSLIYVLGERHLFCLRNTGALKFMKKMEFSPSCFHIYIHGPECAAFVLVASRSTQTLMVYGDVALKWASQLDAIPIAIRRTDLRGLRAAIVCLSDDGKLSCSYLGTNPSIFKPKAIESRDIDYKETDKELAELHKIINASQKSRTLITKQTEASLRIKVTVPKELNFNSSNSDTDEQLPPVPSIDLKVQLSINLPLENVQITCHFENSFTSTPSQLNYQNLNDTTLASLSVRLTDGFVPSTLSGTVASTYIGALGGSPSIVTETVNLPINLVLKACQPQKDADFKITIGVRTAIVKLDELFPEFLDASNAKLTNAGQAMGFQYYHDGPIVTILVAKTSQRYRFQSDSFGAMSLLVKEVKSRLELFSKSRAELDKQPICIYSNPLPLSEFFYVLNTHLQFRLKLANLEKRLGQLAAQFRAIQKRLLSKFKDKTTTPIANLDTLLETTFEQIMSTSDETDECSRKLERSRCLLTAASHFLCILLKLFANLKDTDYELITSALCPQLEDENEQGWEEMVTFNVAHLLQTKFKSDDGVHHGSQSLHSTSKEFCMPNDIGHLRILITRLTEQLSRGVSIVEDEEPSSIEKEGKANNNEPDEHGLPLGTIFGHKVKAVRFVRPLSPSAGKGTDQIQEKKSEQDVPSNDTPKSKSEESNAEETNLPYIHTVSYDPQSLHDDFY